MGTTSGIQRCHLAHLICNFGRCPELFEHFDIDLPTGGGLPGSPYNLGGYMGGSVGKQKKIADYGNMFVFKLKMGLKISLRYLGFQEIPFFLCSPEQVKWTILIIMISGFEKCERLLGYHNNFSFIILAYIGNMRING